MKFRIADTFTDSLARLNGDGQKAAKTTTFDLQLDPVNPGIQLHKIDRARDNTFQSGCESRASTADTQHTAHQGQARHLSSGPC